MRPYIEKEDIGFDIDKAKHFSDMYSLSTDVQCILLDNSGKTLHTSGKCSSLCNKCRHLNKDKHESDSCTQAHLYGSYQAERFGGKYIFFCPMGLTHWASPISSKGYMKASLVSGPVQMVDPDEFLLDELILLNLADKNQVDEIKIHIREIPIIKPDRVNSMSEMLMITTVHISEDQTGRYQDDSELLRQQSNISDYLHYIKTMGGDENSLLSYPLDKEKDLLSLIALGDKSGSQKLLNEIFGHIFFSTGGNFQVIKARVLELIVLLSRAALQGGADVEQIFGLNYRYLSEINDFRNVEQLTFWLSKIMTRFTDCVFNLTNVKHVDVIFRAIDYIKRNYMKKITLEEVSSYVYLSPSYFSKIFKEELKINFNSYLNHIRIEMSKKLLLDDSIILVDISSLVGYEDQSYFSKVFKKMTGVSPGKFRESRGSIKSEKSIRQNAAGNYH